MPSGKDKAAVSLGRRGGKARAARLTPEQRRAAARKAAKARWAKHGKKVHPSGAAEAAGTDS